MSGADVNGGKKTITLELLLAGDGFSGRARSDDGSVHEFNGRLGLMHTIDELLAGASSTKEKNDESK